MDEPDSDLEQHIQKIAKRNPDFPRLVEEARAKREEARAEREQWVGYLPDSERELFIKDIAGLFEECAAEGDFSPLGICIQQWRNTAEVHASPALKELLTKGGEGGGEIIERPANEIVAELEEAVRRLSERTSCGLSGDDGQQQLELEALKALEIVRRMEIQLDQAEFDNPDLAAAYIFEHTSSWTTPNLAELLGVSSKTVGTWKSGGAVKTNEPRVQLAALLIYFLRAGHTELGMQFWFNNPAHQLGDRTPLEIMNKQGERAEVQLIAYARGGRAQLG